MFAVCVCGGFIIRLGGLGTDHSVEGRAESGATRAGSVILVLCRGIRQASGFPRRSSLLQRAGLLYGHR